MADIYVKYPYDPTGRNPDNLVTGELHSLTPITGFPYKIITMNNGGFFARSVRVYDANYNRLVESVDYILTYRYAHTSEMLGLQVCSDIIFLDQTRVGNVFISAQMVGGDVAFSLTAIPDYVTWYKTQPVGYVPRMFDYNGNEPVWLPGELDKERWRLDTYEPFNNEIYEFSRAVEGGRGVGEDGFRKAVRAKYDEFLTRFNDRLANHIADKNNPHQTTKDLVDLGLVNNYRLATIAESRNPQSNELYQTPALTWQTLDALAYVPMNAHINNFNNPHQITPEKLDAPRKEVVNATAASKYAKTEKVANANNFTDGSTSYGYYSYYSFIRSNIPALNFVSGGANGYLNPSRLGNGTPGPNTVLRAGTVPRWVTVESLIAEYKPRSSAGLLMLDTSVVPPSTSPSAAFNIAISQPWAYTASEGSIICYKLNHSYYWGTGNGAGVLNYIDINVAYKSASGWVQV